MDVHDKIKREMYRLHYSPRTAKTYLYCVDEFFKTVKKDVSKVSKSDIRDYLNTMASKNVAGNTLNVHLNALKFFFERVLHKQMLLHLKYSKTPKKLPVFLTQEETRRLINSISNQKHRLMVELMYSAGLRVSELVNLKVKDLEFEGNYGWVRHGKGDKDRRFIIAETLRERLKVYMEANRLDLESWTFNGRNGPITGGSVLMIIKKASKLAKINKKIGTHTLRHSFATHLIENGYDVASVQSLLGHNSLDTTMIYVHMANPKLFNIKSPLDSLEK